MNDDNPSGPAEFDSDDEPRENPEHASADIEDPVWYVMEPLVSASGWLKFIGIMSIIYGALLALTISWILICWAPIWLGIVLLKGVSRIKNGFVKGDLGLIHAGNRQLKVGVILVGVMMIVFPASTAIYILWDIYAFLHTP